MDKIKKVRFNGYPKDKIGTEIGIQDKNGSPIRCGDRLAYKDFKGMVLYCPYSNAYRFYYSYSPCGGGNPYVRDSYSRSLPLPMDNGAKMDLIKLSFDGR